MEKSRETGELDDDSYDEEYLEDVQELRVVNEPLHNEEEDVPKLKLQSLLKTTEIDHRETKVSSSTINNVNSKHFIKYITTAPVKRRMTQDIHQQSTKKPKLISRQNSPYGRINSEIKYPKSKTQYYEQKQQNVSAQRTLMLLEIKKTRLEIEKLERDTNN